MTFFFRMIIHMMLDKIYVMTMRESSLNPLKSIVDFNVYRIYN